MISLNSNRHMLQKGLKLSFVISSASQFVCFVLSYVGWAGSVKNLLLQLRYMIVALVSACAVIPGYLNLFQ